MAKIKMQFTDLKDMLKNTEMKFSDRPAFILKTEKQGEYHIQLHRKKLACNKI